MAKLIITRTETHPITIVNSGQTIGEIMDNILSGQEGVKSIALEFDDDPMAVSLSQDRYAQRKSADVRKHQL